MEQNLEVLFLFLIDLDVADRIVIVILLSPHTTTRSPGSVIKRRNFCRVLKQSI